MLNRSPQEAAKFLPGSIGLNMQEEGQYAPMTSKKIKHKHFQGMFVGILQLMTGEPLTRAQEGGGGGGGQGECPALTSAANVAHRAERSSLSCSKRSTNCRCRAMVASYSRRCCSSSSCAVKGNLNDVFRSCLVFLADSCSEMH